jgi:flagellar hook-associated protein 1 FlgK
MAHQGRVRVVGHNISNASTEGYTRQRVNLTSEFPDDVQVGIIGRGVRISSIERLTDQFLNSSLRKGSSDLKSLELKQTALTQAESVFQDLSDGDLSSALTTFYESLDELAQRPDDMAVRRNVVEQARNLGSLFRTISTGLKGIQKNLNAEVVTSVTQVNALVTDIASLNQQILESRSTGSGNSRDPNDLMDQRDLKLRKLAEFVEIKVFEQSDGQVNVFADGDPLVTQGVANTLTTTTTVTNGVSTSTPVFTGNNGPLVLRSGRLEGLVTSRDTTIPKYLTDLNTLATGVIQEFNKQHAKGIGLNGFSSLKGGNAVTSTTANLNAAGLSPTPVNGSFTIHVTNRITGEVVSSNIPVDLDGIGSDTTLTSLTADIQAIANVSASVGTDNKLTISADSADYTVTFSGDNSNTLAALGLNTLFTGTDASNIDVNAVVDGDLSKLAAALTPAAGDNGNALALAGLRTALVMSSNTTTLDDFYRGSVGTLAVETSQRLSGFDNQRARVDLLENQRQAVSGVNVDEELTQMIEAQRTFQASARFISIVDDMLNTLVNGLF